MGVQQKIYLSKLLTQGNIFLKNKGGAKCKTQDLEYRLIINQLLQYKIILTNNKYNLNIETI